ncbi:putative 25-hydroxycholesterol 7-alpha-hydroxylase [Triangularia setosa]|uniref:25-hydroxycholesterol 7-alpha-hydroxylase n=1 Tax=Triangularia setosa TaxID=2587417 RepID=A0AAN7A176_9PEZI|nr:putative 25-hydroxycholesterol 7-alpha-hydroxylase [Podospora setosa]
MLYTVVYTSIADRAPDAKLDIALSNFVTTHSTLTAAIGSFAATYLFLYAFLHLTQDAKEPPLAATAVPFLSPLVGLVKWSMGFYTHMRDKYKNLPIYTLRLPGIRLYIVNSTHLIPVVQRQWRILLFPPVSARASEVAMGGSKEALDIIREDMVTDTGFMHAFIKATHPALSSGSALDELNGDAMKVLTASLDKVVDQGSKKASMFDWIRHELLMATTDSVYGPHNPLRDLGNEEAWHRYHPTIMFLMLNVLPLWAFRSAIKARDQLAKAFRDYHVNRHYAQGSVYIQRWTEHFVSRGIPADDIGRCHNGGMFALVANTIPTAFWMVYRVFSDPSVTDDCRKEVLKAVTVKEENGVQVFIVRARTIKESCPTLVSTFQEVFRVHGMANSVRIANEDHLLDGKYLIKKGGIIMMPARVQHHSKDVWGEDVEVFNARRFIRKPGEPRPNPVAFRGFGGGTTLCPGRHFATTEILLFTAMLLLRFDILPAAGGEWVMPTTEKSSQAEAMEQPDYDIDIELRPRPGADRKWRVSFEGTGEAALVAEDL